MCVCPGVRSTLAICCCYWIAGTSHEMVLAIEGSYALPWQLGYRANIDPI